MKFKLLSDLHLEFYNRKRPGLPEVPMWEPAETEEDADTVLLLAGDIHVGPKALPWIEKMVERFATVVYILGNHEFYGQEYYKTIDFWIKADEELDGLMFLHDDYATKDGVRIFGGTLWTEVTDAFNMWHGRKAMTDYNVVKLNVDKAGYYRKLNVQDTNGFHLETIQKLQQFLQTPFEGKTIVMTHHLPHNKCVAERFKGSNLNDFFMTDLDHIIKRFDIDVWCHGHTHDNVDVEVHGTRILCNPMGYHGVQLNQEFNEGLTFDL
jgi:predicted phosphodiesterase